MLYIKKYTASESNSGHLPRYFCLLLREDPVESPRNERQKDIATVDL